MKDQDYRCVKIVDVGRAVFSSSVRECDMIKRIDHTMNPQIGIVMVSVVLLGILAQQLIPRTSAEGRVLATEVLFANHAVRSLIREGKTHQIYSVIQTAQRESMRTMNQALYELCIRGAISHEEAMMRTTEPQDLERLFKR